ncbi:MAG: DUF433 domain-containing protein [Planctomycetaceae bacterium]|nr:DUF433 domain-containing protein [Planctomycetaceae bacterium]
MSERITTNAGVHNGRPCVAGTRIPAEDVIELVDAGISFAKIIKDYYPALTVEDIEACIKESEK